MNMLYIFVASNMKQYYKTIIRSKCNEKSWKACQIQGIFVRRGKRKGYSKEKV